MDTKTKIDLINTDPDFATSIDGAPISDDWLLQTYLGNSFERYTEILKDTHFTSRVNTRIQSILGRGVKVEPASDRKRDHQAAKGIASMLRLRTPDKLQGELDERSPAKGCIPYESLTQMLAWGIAFGHSIVLNDLREDNGLIVPCNYRSLHRDRSYFVQHDPMKADVPVITNEDVDPADGILLSQGYEVRVLTRRAPTTGERIPKGRGIHFSFGSPNLNPWGIGLASACWRWYTIKNTAPKQWLVHAAHGASPGTWGHIPGADPSTAEGLQQIQAFEAFLASISPGAWYRSPAAEAIVNRAADGTIDSGTYAGLIKEADEQMSELILGDRSYAEKDSGSRAANESQVMDRNLTITDSDCNLIDEAIQEHHWNAISRLNFPNASPPAIRRGTYAERLLEEEQTHAAAQREESRARRIDGDRVLFVDMGWQPSDEYMEEHYPEWKVGPVPGPERKDDTAAPDVIVSDRFRSTEEFPSFAEIVGNGWEEPPVFEFADRQARCSSGLSCGLSCVDPSLACVSSVTTEQDGLRTRITRYVRNKDLAAVMAGRRPLTSKEKSRETGYLASDKKWIQGEIDKLRGRDDLSQEEQQRLDTLKSDLAAKDAKIKAIEDGTAVMAGGSGAGLQSPFFDSESDEERAEREGREAKDMVRQLLADRFLNPIDEVLSVGMDGDDVVSFFRESVRVMAMRMSALRLAYRIVSADGTFDNSEGTLLVTKPELAELERRILIHDYSCKRDARGRFAGGSCGGGGKGGGGKGKGRIQKALNSKNGQRIVKLAKAKGPDLIVSGISSGAGMAITAAYGPVAGFASEIGVSLVTRQAVNFGVAALTAKQRLSHNAQFQSASRLAKARQVGSTAVSELRSRRGQRKIGNDLTGDLFGSAVGNASAMAMASVIPALGNVPLRGALVATQAVPRVQAIRNRFLSAESGE